MGKLKLSRLVLSGLLVCVSAGLEPYTALAQLQTTPAPLPNASGVQTGGLPVHAGGSGSGREGVEEVPEGVVDLNLNLQPLTAGGEAVLEDVSLLRGDSGRTKEFSHSQVTRRKGMGFRDSRLGRSLFGLPKGLESILHLSPKEQRSRSRGTEIPEDGLSLFGNFFDLSEYAPSVVIPELGEDRVRNQVGATALNATEEAAAPPGLHGPRSSSRASGASNVPELREGAVEGAPNLPPLFTPTDRAVIRVADMRMALNILKINSHEDATLHRTLRDIRIRFPKLKLRSDRVFLITDRDVWKSLELPTEVAGAARILQRGLRREPVILVNNIKPVTLEALVEITIHEALHIRDGKPLAIPRKERIQHWLIEGYTQIRAHAMAEKFLRPLGLSNLPNATYTREVAAAWSFIDAYGERPLEDLVSKGSTHALKEALGRRWRYIEELGRLDALTSGKREKLLTVIAGIAKDPAFDLVAFESIASSLYSGVSPATVSQVVRKLERRENSGFWNVLDRLAEPFTTLHSPQKPTFSGQLLRASESVVALTFLHAAKYAAVLAAVGGFLLPSWMMPSTYSLLFLVLQGLLLTFLTAIGEEVFFRRGMYEYLERGFKRIFAQPQPAILLALAVSSVIFSLGHFIVEPWSPVSFVWRIVLTVAFTRMYKRFGLRSAIMSHYLWNMVVYAWGTFPALTPYFLALAPVIFFISLALRRPAR